MDNRREAGEISLFLTELFAAEWMILAEAIVAGRRAHLAALPLRIGLVVLAAAAVASNARGQGHSIGGPGPVTGSEYRSKIQRANFEQATPGPWAGHSTQPALQVLPPYGAPPAGAYPPQPGPGPGQGTAPRQIPGGGPLPPGYVDSNATEWPAGGGFPTPSPPSVTTDPRLLRPGLAPPAGPMLPGNPSYPTMLQGNPQVPGPPPMPPGMVPATEPRYSLRFQNAPWAVVLRQCARDFGMSLDMRQAPAGGLSYYDENDYTESQFLDILNDHLLREGFILARNGRKLSLCSSAERIDDGAVPFVSLPQLDGLGRNELASVAFPYEMLSEGTIAEMQQVMSPMGRVRTLTNARRVIVTDTGNYLRRIRDLLTGTGVAASEIHTITFRLRNAPAEEAAVAINNVLLSGMVGPAAPVVVPAGGPAPSAAPVGPQMVVPEKVTNRLFARGTSHELGIIERLICEIDAPPPQVFIQALLVEVQLGNTDEFGVEVGVQDSVLFDRSVIDNILTVTETVTNPTGTQTTNQRIVSQTANPGFNFNNQPLGNNVRASPSIVGTQGLSSLGVGRVNGDLGFGGLVLSAGSESISVLLRALSARHHIDVLSRPQIRTLDNHEAVIQIGQQVPVVDGVAITGVGSANPVIRQDQAGIILRVMPRIGPDGLVLMDVNAEKSAFQLTPGTGVPIFTDATNGNVIEAPVKDVTSAQTAVGARTGQTIVLGGMITRDHATVERKVPVLGDIPIIGHAFRYDREQSVRKELLIFLTPYILDGPADEERMKAVETSKVVMPWHDVTEMHGEIFADPPLLPDGTVLPGPGLVPAIPAPAVLPPQAGPLNAVPPGGEIAPVSHAGNGRRGTVVPAVAESAPASQTAPPDSTAPRTVGKPGPPAWTTLGRWRGMRGKTDAPGNGK